MKLSKTEELFLKAYSYNWDDGIGTLEKIIENKNCDKATVLLIYWLARPVYYNKYNSIDEMPEYERPAYNLIKRIEELVINDRLPEIISYEPDPGLIPLDIGRIPEKMTEPSRGEIDSQALIHNESGELKLLKACEDGDLETVKSKTAQRSGHN